MDITAGCYTYNLVRSRRLPPDHEYVGVRFEFAWQTASFATAAEKKGIRSSCRNPGDFSEESVVGMMGTGGVGESSVEYHVAGLVAEMVSRVE